MLSLSLFLHALGLALCETLAQFSVKKYYDSGIIYFFFLGWFFYLCVITILYYTYFITNFAIANAIWSSLTIILTTTITIFYFKDKLNTMELLGISFVILGILLLGSYNKKQETPL